VQKKHWLLPYLGWGKILGGVFCLYLYVISFDFDSGVSIPVTLTFWPGGKHPSKPPPPAPMRGCYNSQDTKVTWN